MNRFFLEAPPDRDGRTVFAAEDHNHIVKVLRLRPGDRVIAVFSGAEYQVELIRVDQGEVLGRATDQSHPNREPKVRVTIVQGLPKGDKMETVIQKGTEIGATAFWPAQAERSVIHLDRVKAPERRERWQRVAREAARQSGRLAVPEVLPVGDLTAILTEIGRRLAENRSSDRAGIMALMPHEGETVTGMRCALDQIGPGSFPREGYLVIGPEGGLGDDELAAALRAGVQPVTLGPRILRTETAGPAALAALLYHFGDFGD